MAATLEDVPTQTQAGEVLGISQPAVSDLYRRGVFKDGMPLRLMIQAYCANLRQVAAGRVAVGDIELVTERARLAREQADRVAMLNAERRNELVALKWVSAVLAKHSRQMASIFDAIVPQLRRLNSNLTALDLEFVEKEVTKARNLAAEIDVTEADLRDECGGDTDSPEGWTEAPEESEASEAQ